MKPGDTVRLIAIPPDVRDDRELQTRTLFEKCLGKTFPIVALETVDGLPYPLVKLDVGHILGEPTHLETIWVEPEYLQLENPE
ncbi:MAG: hypothetical protein ABSB39_17155 [Candidatus Sulfotelmatobacter sp.]